jgi:hypothetical protein
MQLTIKWRIAMKELEKLGEYIDDFNDSLKIRVELFKHLSTLSSGTIVIIAAFIRELPAGSSKFLLATSLLSFVLTILFSAWASFYTLGYIITAKKYVVGAETLEQFIKIDQGRMIGFVPIIFFILGMISLALFSLSAI